MARPTLYPIRRAHRLTKENDRFIRDVSEANGDSQNGVLNRMIEHCRTCYDCLDFLGVTIKDGNIARARGE